MTSKSNEFDIRRAVVAGLLKSGVHRRDIRIEIPLDTNSSAGRADIVVLLDKKIGCIELKSGRDKFCRVAIRAQTDIYRRSFDYCATIVDKIHKKETIEERSWGKQRVSNWDDITAEYHHDTGLIVEDCGQYGPREIHFLPIKLFNRMSHRTCVYDMLSILWKHDIGRGTKCGTIEKWRQEKSLIEVREIVIAALHDRPFNKWEEKFWSQYDAGAVT